MSNAVRTSSQHARQLLHDNEALKRERDNYQQLFVRTVGELGEVRGLAENRGMPIHERARMLREELDEFRERAECAERIAKLRYEALEECQRTITRLNRRCQLAESGVLEADRKIAGGPGLGRALANATASLHRGRAATLEQGLRDLRSYLGHAGQDADHDWMARHIARVIGERHRGVDTFDPLTDEQMRHLRDGAPPRAIGLEDSEVVVRLISMLDRAGMLERLAIAAARGTLADEVTR